MEKNAFIQWVTFVSFAVLLVGGVNYLFMCFFDFEMFGWLFAESVAARVCYGLFGTATAILIAVIVYKAFSSGKKQSTAKKTTAA